MWRTLFRLSIINSRMCFTEIVSNKTRSFITSFGIFLGVASLLGMIAFVRGFQNDTERQLEQMGGVRTLTIEEIEAESPEEQLSFARSPGLRLYQVQKTMEEIPEIEAVFPVGEGPYRRLKANGRERWAFIQAVSYGHLHEYNYKVGRGRAFDKEDYEKGNAVAIIGERVAERMWDTPEDAIGNTVAVGPFLFKVIGLIETPTQRDFRRMHFLYPYPIYQDRIAGHGGRISKIDVKVKSIKHIESVRNQLEHILLGYHRGVQDFEVQLNTEKLEDQQKANKVLSILLGVIASVSLIVGGIGIANIMFATISERIREIGIRKALGAGKSDLFAQFLIESVFLCIVGVVSGMILGTVPVLLPGQIFPFEPSLKLVDYILAVSVSVLIGVVSGIMPALKAAKMEPIEALNWG